MGWLMNVDSRERVVHVARLPFVDLAYLKGGSGSYCCFS